MGLLGIHSKSNLGKTRFDTALLCLLFISTYQTHSLIDQGFPWLSILFILSGVCQLFFLLNSQKKKCHKYAAVLCVVLSWIAVLSSNFDKSLVMTDWFIILIIAGYLMLTINLANTISGIGLAALLFLLYLEQGFYVSVIQLLPFFILLIVANLLSSQNAYLTSAFKRSQVSDPLTGCANSEHFMQEVIKSSDIYCRYKISMSLIALKMDLPSEEVEMIGRKKFDQYQISLSQIWASRIRDTDILCRYHDGLFLVLLPSTKLENALSLANDLTKASGDYDYDNHVNIKIHTKTVSHDGIENWETWFNRAAL
jgi:diguanylate cyclase (GGDEF)-like protein